MLEIRIHGRGGQGNVVAAYLLASAAFEAGLNCQAFPAFGAERRGAPVTAFVRIGSKPIRRRNQVREPAFLIVQDQSLLHEPGLTEGLLPGGGVLVNSNKTSDEITREYGREMTALPASALAQEIFGRPVPNVALLSALLTMSEIIPLDALAKALARRFKGDVLKKNRKLIPLAASLVEAGAWKERAHA